LLMQHKFQYINLNGSSWRTWKMNQRTPTFLKSTWTTYDLVLEGCIAENVISSADHAAVKSSIQRCVT